MMSGDERKPVPEALIIGPDGGASPGAVHMQLERLLQSSGFRFSERLSRFLKFVVLESLAGNDGQLKESVLAAEIFDRGTTYDSRVDSVVRVEARRLREKLDKYYSAEGGGDPVVISLPKGSYVPLITVRLGAAETAPPVEPAAAPARSRRVPMPLRAAVIAGAGVVCVVAAIMAGRWTGPRTAGHAPSMRRLTSDLGLTFQPALSPDGRLVAYSSDRGGKGDLDIWVQQVAGADALRVTDNAGDELEPTFSPDGTSIAYRAEGEAGGIYTVPALGGKSTLVVRDGYRPRFSPDGTRIAYWTGERNFRTAKILVVPVSGGAPVEVQTGLHYSAYPVWSPDGKRVAFVGGRDMFHGDPNVDEWDWWVAPVDGGPAVRTEAREAFRKQGLRMSETGWAHHRRIIPSCWTPSGHLVFSARAQDETNIWRIPISTRDWHVNGPAEQLTFGVGRQDHPSFAADGSLAFTVLTEKTDIWSLPIDTSTAEPRGPMVQLTSGQAKYSLPVISRDGTRLAFIRAHGGETNVGVMDLHSGRETSLTATRAVKASVLLSPDGTRVAFGHAPPEKESIFYLPYRGGTPVQLCSDCGNPRAWLPDATALVYQRSTPKGDSVIGLLDLSGRTSPLIESSESALYSAAVSPDGMWIAFIVRTPPNDHRIAVAPLRYRTVAPEAERIAVAGPGSWVDKPRWSPDGNVLYYVSDRDGFLCIWSCRLDPATKRPARDPKAVLHFHHGRSSLGTVYGLEISVAVDKLVFNLGEGSGNIWMAPARSGRER